ncbi:MAG: hypothetical protein QMC67_14135 [Candidatus Wallbacteria bacterium]
MHSRLRLFKFFILISIFSISIFNFTNTASAGTFTFAARYVLQNPGAVFGYIAHNGGSIISDIKNNNIKERAVDFCLQNSDSIVDYAVKYKNDIPQSLIKGNEQLVNLGLNYTASNQTHVKEYIAQNKNEIKKAVNENKFQDLGINYALNNSNKILTFAAANQKEIQNLDALKGNGKEVGLALKYASENKDGLSSYITNNKDNIKKAIDTKDFKNLAIDYALSNSNSVLKFAVNNQKDIKALPVVKDAVKGYEKEVDLGLKYTSENLNGVSNFVKQNPDAIKEVIDGKADKIKNAGIDYLCQNIDGVVKFAITNNADVKSLGIFKSLMADVNKSLEKKDNNSSNGSADTANNQSGNNSGTSNGNTENSANTDQSANNNSNNGKSVETAESKLKNTFIDYLVKNPDTCIKVIEAYKDAIPENIIKEYKTESKIALGYILEEREAVSVYIKSNQQQVKDAINEGKWKELAIGYVSSNPESLIKYIIRHKKELPEDSILLIIKYAVKDKTLGEMLTKIINNRSLSAEAAIKLAEIILNSKSIFAPAADGRITESSGDSSKAANISETIQSNGQTSILTPAAVETSSNINSEELKAAQEKLNQSYKRFIDANMPESGTEFNDYKNAVEAYQRLIKK